MNNVLQQCIASFGPAPRNISLWNRTTYLRLTRPDWLSHYPADKLHTLFRGADTLFRNGRIVWGHIIQANELLFTKGNDNCPGEFVYSLADKADPPLLEEVAHKLGELKGTKPDNPDHAEIAEYLTNERIRVYGLKVPYTISPDLPCLISTTFFVRKHLPGRVLSWPLMPILVNPAEPHVVLPLPVKYWPKDFAKWWAE